MAKAGNELNLSVVKRKLNTPNVKKTWTKIFNNLSTEQRSILNKLVATENLNCHIFTGSVAFRVGKSSIKNIAGYPSGFKADFGSTANAEKVFNTTNFASFNRVTKQNFVQIAAFYFLYKSPDKVKTESDKTEAAEGEQISITKSKLNALIKDSRQIRVKVGESVYTINSIEQVQTRSKADAYLAYNRTPVVFLSLKKGARPGDFQQYGGLADLGIMGENYTQYPDIVTFRKHIDDMFKMFGLKPKNGKYDFNDLKIGSYFGFFLNNPTTACKAIFGRDFGSNDFGFNNCHATIDGDINFKRVGRQLNTFELDGEYHLTLNPYTYKNNARSFDPGEVYKPVLFVQKSESQGLNQLGYLNARFNIWPNNKVATKGRQNLDEIISAINSKDKRQIFELKQRYLKKVTM